MLDEIEKKVALINDTLLSKKSNLSNDDRRKLYSQAQLAILDIEESYLSKNQEYDQKAKDIIVQLNSLSEKLFLKPVVRQRYVLDEICRFIFINAGLFFLGIFASLPFIAITSVENILCIPTSKGISLQIRKYFAWLMLTVAGIVADVINLDESQLNALESSSAVSILTFSHSSNLDGFLVSLTCPLNHYALAKKELFIVPFFSWLSFAIGGIPVDRGNRERAVNSLQRSAKMAKYRKMCIVIAPEGTRSTTGQLLPFKKGTFHMWEQLKGPIMPFISFGGYDLFPVGKWLNTPGKVVIQYLPVIKHDEAKTRDDMLRLVRRRMLAALMVTPNGVCEPLTWLQYANTYAVGFGVLAFNVIAARSGISYMSARNVSPVMSLSYFILSSAFVTMGLYSYNLYLRDMLSQKERKSA